MPRGPPPVASSAAFASAAARTAARSNAANNSNNLLRWSKRTTAGGREVQDDPDRHYFERGLGRLDASDESGEDDDDEDAAHWGQDEADEDGLDTEEGADVPDGNENGLKPGENDARPRGANWTLTDIPPVDPNTPVFNIAVRPGEGDDAEGAADRSGSEGSDGGDSLSESEDEAESAQERYEWQNMLANVLQGDVLRSEKNRMSSTLAHQLDNTSGQRKYKAAQIWLGVKAFVRCRTLESESRFLAEARAQIEPIVEEILSFKVNVPDDHTSVDLTTMAAEQVQGLLARATWTVSLYSSIKTLATNHPSVDNSAVSERIEALQSWTTITKRLRVQVSILQKWTGSDSLEITKPGLEKIDEDVQTTPDLAERSNDFEHSRHTKRKILDTSNFVERMLKEDRLDTVFEKRTLKDIFPLVTEAKAILLANRALFTEIGLPPFSDDLIALINFPMSLMREALSLRLDLAQRVHKEDPSVVLIDQLTGDFKKGLELAATMKRQYVEIVAPDPANNWVLPHFSLAGFDEVLRDALKFFFKLLHWKLKSGNKAIYLKETEIVESEWEFLSRAIEQIEGGDLLVAEHFSFVHSFSPD